MESSAFSESNAESVKKYIAEQEEHHAEAFVSGRFVAFLKKNNVAYCVAASSATSPLLAKGREKWGTRLRRIGIVSPGLSDAEAECDSRSFARHIVDVYFRGYVSAVKSTLVGIFRLL